MRVFPRIPAVVVLMTLAATGCVGCDPAAGRAPATGAATPSASASPGEAVVDFSFAAGASLSAHVRAVQWNDPFLADARFEVESADDGEGRWAYRDTVNQCTISFYQGRLTDVPHTSDDAVDTDATIALVNQSVDPSTTPALVAQYGEDAALPVRGSDAVVDARLFGGQTVQGRTRADVARYFGALDAVLYAGIVCPTGEPSAYDEFDELRAAGSLAVVVATKTD